MSKNLLAIVLLFLFANNYAIELSLEENKAESGTIGYVDIEKVFQRYAIKTEIRDKFLEKVKEKESLIYSKKEEINELKNQIIKLKQEKELAITLNKLYESFTESAKAIINSSGSFQQYSSTPNIQNFELEKSTNDFENIISTDTKSLQVVIENSTDNIKNTLSASTGNYVDSKLIFVDSETSKIPVVNMPGIENIPLTHFKFSVSTSAAEIEKIIYEKEKQLQEKEEELKNMKKEFDKELLEYEEVQTESILGDIYIKLKEISIREGVSVVVDKKSILFGHKAVDLTDKLIKELEK